MAPNCTVLVSGGYQTGKKRIIASYVGKEVNTLVMPNEVTLLEQIKGKKGDVTIQGLPMEFGRVPAFRERLAAMKESQVFIITASGPQSKVDHYYNNIQKNVGKMGPTVIVYTYSSSDAAKGPIVIPVQLAAFSKKNNIKIETLKVDPVSYSVKSSASCDAIQLEKIVSKLVFEFRKIPEAVTPTGDKKEAEKEKEKEKESDKKDTSIGKLLKFFSSFRPSSTTAAA